MPPVAAANVDLPSLKPLNKMLVADLKAELVEHHKYARADVDPKKKADLKLLVESARNARGWDV